MAQMARPAPQPRSGGGVGTIIFFALLSIILIVGYVPVCLALAERVEALRSLQENIQLKLESPLKGKASLSLQAPAVKHVKYSDQFFTDVQKLAATGIKYNDLINTLGWPEEAAQQQITDLVQAANKASLNNLVTDQQAEITRLQGNVKQIQGQLENTRAERDNYLKERDRANRNLQTQVKQALGERDKARADAKVQMDKYKKLWDEAHLKRQEAWALYDKEKKRFESAEKGLNEKMGKLKNEVAELREILKGKEPEKLPEAVARVNRADSINGFIIVDRGLRDGMQNGEKLLIYRSERGGKYAKKGEATIVNAQEYTSRADVTLERELDPIAMDDLIFKVGQPPDPAQIIASAEEFEKEEEKKARRGSFAEERQSVYFQLRR